MVAPQGFLGEKAGRLEGLKAALERTLLEG
jgi:hypothetical protein